MRCFLITALLLGTSSAYAGAIAWECEVRPLDDAGLYVGTGPTEIEAKEAGIQQCKADGHIWCYADACQQYVPDDGGDSK